MLLVDELVLHHRVPEFLVLEVAFRAGHTNLRVSEVATRDRKGNRASKLGRMHSRKVASAVA